RGDALGAGMVARFGLPNLVAVGLLVVGWFFLPAVSIDASIFGKLEFTFWQVLGFLNSSNTLEALAEGRRGGPSPGIYGLFAIVCLSRPFVSFFLENKRAALSGVLPLFFLVVFGLFVGRHLHNPLCGAA